MYAIKAQTASDERELQIMKLIARRRDVGCPCGRSLDTISF
jgi:hypothetical protein